MVRVLTALVLLCPGIAIAGDWPQWLGPTRDAVTEEKIAAWKSAPTVVWRKNIGEGHSSPIVADGKVYLHARPDGKDEEVLTAFDAKTGDIGWEKSYPRGEFKTPFGNGPRGTPCVAGEMIYTLGGTGILTGFETKDGKQVWQVDTLKDFKAPNITFGMSASPLVVDDKVIVQVGGKGASIVAFDAKTGKVAWQTGDDPASYAAPAMRNFNGEKQLIVLTARHLIGLTPDKGKTLWEVPFRDFLNESSTTPIMVNDTLIASSVTAGSIGLKRLDKDGVLTTTQTWKNGQLTCYFGTPIPFGKSQVLMVTGGLIPPPTATLRAVDAATGKEVWNKPGVGKYHATLLRLGDGNVLMIEESGEMVLLDGSATVYKELARAKICGQTWAHPAISNGMLYIRDAKELICLKVG